MTNIHEHVSKEELGLQIPNVHIFVSHSNIYMYMCVYPNVFCVEIQSFLLFSRYLKFQRIHLPNELFDVCVMCTVWVDVVYTTPDVDCHRSIDRK